MPAAPVPPRLPGARHRRGARLLGRAHRLPGRAAAPRIGSISTSTATRSSPTSPPKHDARPMSNPVDGHDVPVPHFGIVLTLEDWQALADRLTAAGVKFAIEPHIRFKGQPGRAGDDVLPRSIGQCDRDEGLRRSRFCELSFDKNGPYVWYERAVRRPASQGWRPGLPAFASGTAWPGLGSALTYPSQRRRAGRGAGADRGDPGTGRTAPCRLVGHCGTGSSGGEPGRPRQRRGSSLDCCGADKAECRDAGAAPLSWQRRWRKRGSARCW